MIKGKNGFWLLVIIFSVIIMLVVVNNQNSGMVVQEMGGTMGQMMFQMHGGSIGSVVDNAVGLNWLKATPAMGSAGAIPGWMKSLDFSSSMAVLMILPILIGASVILIILWI